ncbi:hypothetical protein GJ496_004408 [Pomphorhynchus laevis]|nr:hypothetical protein GJ496_004408 [Pomphorhynchus laevis]
MKEIYLIRHGEFLNINYDGPLTIKGQKQASKAGQCLAQELQGRVIDLFVVSHKYRTLQTAAIIKAELLGGNIEIKNCQRSRLWNEVSGSVAAYNTILKLAQTFFKCNSDPERHQRRDNKLLVVTTHSNLIVGIVCYLMKITPNEVGNCEAALNPLSKHTAFTKLYVYSNFNNINLTQMGIIVDQYSTFRWTHLRYNMLSVSNVNLGGYLMAEFNNQIITSVQAWRNHMCSVNMYQRVFEYLIRVAPRTFTSHYQQHADNSTQKDLYNYLDFLCKHGEFNDNTLLTQWSNFRLSGRFQAIPIEETTNPSSEE